MTTSNQKHPEQKVLTDFGLGRLDPSESSWIEEHLAECKECCDTLLNLKDDTFTGIVRTLPKAADPETDGIAEPHAEAPRLSPTEVAATDGGVDDNSVHAATMLVQSGEAIEAADLPADLHEHPRYEIVELIGQGGMGAVYRAQHRLMNRPVALKLISSQLIRHPQAVERFRREVQAAAQLAHPNIVAAYDAEQAGDVHFLAMEFVEGTDLSDVIERRGPLSVEEACDYIRQAALGLQHAHEKGMVHRDIKPHNLMLSPDGQVRILDFGLAGFATESAIIEADATSEDPGDTTPLHLTTMGSVMGTPDYIAPEQARDAHSADIRADIYSLGCTLYCLLSGSPPHQSDSVVEKLKAHAEREPEAIEAVRVDVPEELAEVVRRMMSKDPADRFQTPAEVADALAPFVDTHRSDGGGNDADRTSPAAASEPFRFASRVLAAAGWLSVIAAILAIGNRGWITFQYPEWCAPWLTIGSILSFPVGLLMLRVASRLRRQRSWRVVFAISSLGLLPLNPTSVAMLPLVVWLLRFLCRPEVRSSFEPEAQPLTVASQNRTGRRVCLAASLLVGTGLLGLIIHFGTDSGQLIIEVDDPNLTVKISRRGRTMRLLENGDTRITFLPSGDYRITIPGNDGTVTVKPDRVEITRGVHRFVTIRAVATKKPVVAGITQIRRFGDAHTHRVRDVALVPSDSGAVIATASFDGSVRLWDTATGQQTLALLDHDRIASAVAASPDGNTLATTDGSGNVRLWDRQTGQQKLIIPDHKGWMFDLAFSPDGQKLFVPIAKYGDGKVSGKVLVYAVATGDLIRELSGIKQGIHAVIPVNANQVLVAGEYHLAGVWDVQTGEPIRIFEGLHQHAYAVALSPDARTVATGHPVDKLRGGKLDDPETAVIGLWDIETGRLIRKLHGHSGSVNGLAWSHDSRFVISGSGGRSHGSSYTRAWDNSLRVWDAESGKEVARATLENTINSLVILPDGKHVVTVGGDDEADVRLWQLPEAVWPDRMESKTPTDADRLQGVWIAESGVNNGEAVPADQIGIKRAVFDGDRLTVEMPQGLRGEGYYQLVENTNPRQIGIFVSGENKGARGIYKLDNDTLTLCTDLKPGGELPVKFSAPAGTTFDLIVLRRATVSDRDLIQGKWKGVALTDNGEKQSLDDHTERFMTFTGTQFTGPQRKQPKPGKFTLDSTTSPKQIDLHFPSGPDSFIRIQGIYRLEGDRLTIFQATDWTASKRPTSFEPKPGDKRSLLVFERVPDWGELQGTWKAVGLEASGQTAPEPAYKDRYIVIRGDHITRVGRLSEIDSFLDARDFRIDPAATPKTLDISKTNDGEFKEFSKSIYELNGDTLRVCFSQRDDAPRPMSFDTAGTKYFCFTMKRVKTPSQTNSTSHSVPPRPGTGILSNPPSVPSGGLPTGENLIGDPSLEGTETGRLPKGWFVWLDDGPEFKCEVVEGGVTGKHCLRISGNGKRGVVFCTSIPMDRTKRYALKGHVKVEGDAGTWAVIKLNYFNKTGWLGVDDHVGVKSGESGWKFFEKTDRANAFPEATLMVPTCHIEGNGTAWFDDLEVIAYDRDKLPEDFDKKHGKNNRMYSLE